ncbi:glycoside hydrolase family 10 protein [Pirellulimonas nuda]|uniref:glycoside hydrolase family 10 protein n=1 Tax=Pirellulimonas nuda TaxID=2528009 RepID=UPI0018D399BC|nr:family 10 glycosylhydrolase [Pirellulimonas nuda]
MYFVMGIGGRASGQAPPAPLREFRAAWIATVANIDWPSAPGLSAQEQQKELVALLDKAAELNLNAIVLQVRPACDAMYASKLEPWSEFLTGAMGRPPTPRYDPLEFAVREAHARGLQLHAWFNPYRALHSSSKGPVSDDHVSRKHPGMVREYGGQMWLDPGDNAAIDHSLRVIRDVVKRYDIDGVHLDDYFYPYPVDEGSAKKPFPDDASWATYLDSLDGQKPLSRDDWRRDNVNRFIHRLSEEVKAEKPWVQFGVSPFGIWRPGYPETIRGFDPYEALYADAKLWFQEGWVDYLTPQLYWMIDPPAQSYPVLMNWWIEQNEMGRHLWPGLYTSKVRDSGGWPAAEIVNQVKLTQQSAGAQGNVHFSMKALAGDRGGVATALKQGPYAQPALVPASPWLAEGPAPALPSVAVKRGRGGAAVSWRPAGRGGVAAWVVQTHSRGVWETQVLPADQKELKIDSAVGVQRVAVSAVDRLGRQGPTAIAEVTSAAPAGADRAGRARE